MRPRLQEIPNNSSCNAINTDQTNRDRDQDLQHCAVHQKRKSEDEHMRGQNWNADEFRHEKFASAKVVQKGTEDREDDDV